MRADCNGICVAGELIDTFCFSVFLNFDFFFSLTLFSFMIIINDMPLKFLECFAIIIILFNTHVILPCDNSCRLTKKTS